MITRRDWWLGIGAIVGALLLIAYFCWPSFRVNKAIVQAASGPGAFDDPMRLQEKALKDAAKGQVGIFVSAVKLYKFHTKKLPPNLEGLVAAPADADIASRWAGPYLDSVKVPLDPWDHEYKFVTPGKHSKDGFDV